jgi:hypothetical protein
MKASPMKLSREFFEVMDSGSEGQPSELFDYFKVGGWASIFLHVILHYMPPPPPRNREWEPQSKVSGRLDGCQLGRVLYAFWFCVCSVCCAPVSS